MRIGKAQKVYARNPYYLFESQDLEEKGNDTFQEVPQQTNFNKSLKSYFFIDRVACRPTLSTLFGIVRQLTKLATL